MDFSKSSVISSPAGLESHSVFFETVIHESIMRCVITYPQCKHPDQVSHVPDATLGADHDYIRAHIADQYAAMNLEQSPTSRKVPSGSPGEVGLLECFTSTCLQSKPVLH